MRQREDRIKGAEVSDLLDLFDEILSCLTHQKVCYLLTLHASLEQCAAASELIDILQTAVCT